MESLPMPAPFGFPHDLQQQQQQQQQHNVSTCWLLHTPIATQPLLPLPTYRVLMPLQLFAAGCCRQHTTVQYSTVQ